MFEFLFKYPAEFFTRGSLILALPGWQLALLPLAILGIVFIMLGYFRLRAGTNTTDRLTIALFRSLAIFLVVFSLLRPLLEVTSRLPQPNLVGVLIDNSISMRIRDAGAGARSDFVARQLDAVNGELLQGLSEQFDTRIFRFGKSVAAVSDVSTLDYSDGDSNLVQALNQVRQTLKGEPLAGLVVIGDGAMQSTGQLDETLLALRADDIPVYSLGLGQAQYRRDIEISRVKLPRQVMQGSRVVADLSIKQQGYDGQTMDLVVEDDSRILHKQQLSLQPGVNSLKIPLAAAESGPRQLRFYLANKSGEQIAANNSRQAVLAVDDRKTRILHFEGEPRFELKFIRRAISDDENLQVTGLIRTADAKFYRVGIETADELRNGFPITREELFAYDALILGSVEIALLSREQQQMIVEFVSKRGGGLLMLGGRHAFAEGGYRDSVLHDLSPVVMAEQAWPEFTRRIKIRPTAAAWTHPALLLADSDEKSIERWLSLPALTIVNPIRQIKPGATLLLSSTPNDDGDPWVAMAMQRYGRGKVVAFPVQNSWLWQMHHQIDLEDQTHETLWRQLLRWLVEGVPQRMSLTLSTHRIHVGGVIELRGEVLTPEFDAHAQARPRAVITGPDGLERVQYLSPHPSLQGIYNGEISVTEPGNYWLRIESDEQGEAISSDETRFRVSLAGDEYHQSEMNETLLRRISQETGGGFFTPRDTDDLVDALAAHQRGSNTLVRYELWDMPVIFLLLVLCLGAEWGYRRWRNLV